MYLFISNLTLIIHLSLVVGGGGCWLVVGGGGGVKWGQVVVSDGWWSGVTVVDYYHRVAYHGRQRGPP